MINLKFIFITTLILFSIGIASAEIDMTNFTMIDTGYHFSNYIFLSETFNVVTNCSYSLNSEE